MVAVPTGRLLARIPAAVAAVTLSAVLVGCSGGDDGTDDPTTTTVFVPQTVPDLRSPEPAPSPYLDNDALGDLGSRSS